MNTLLKNWQKLHIELVQKGEFRTARKLLSHVQTFKRYGRCSISLYSNDDWVIAGKLDPGHNGFSFKLS